MPQDPRASKPTCSTCPFFYRARAASIGDPGDCLYGRATPVPMGQNPQGGLIIGTMRPRTTPDATCNDHPAMAGWLARTYGPPSDAREGHTRIGRYANHPEPERPDRDDDREAEPDIHAHAEPDAREREDDHARERDENEERNRIARDTAESRLILGMIGKAT